MGGTSGQARAALAATVGAGLLGLAPIGVRLSELGPQATNLWRFVFALPILAALAALVGPPPTRRDGAWLLFAGLLFGLELSLWAAALGKTTVANATLLANMTPVVAAAFGWLVFKERLGAATLGGGLAALAGAVILALARAQAGEGPASPEQGWVGDGMGLAAAFGYAGYLIIVRGLGARVGVGAVMFWATLSAAAYALALSLALGEALLPRTLEGWAILVGLGVVVQAGAQGLIAYGVGRLPIVVSTVLLWMQPLSAAVLSWIIFGEELGPLALFGAALILSGLFVVQRSRAKVAS
jgi:drug/metabolite transporter (DMT)-like permease